MKSNQTGQILILLLASLLLGGAGVSAVLLLTGSTANEIRKDALSMVEGKERRDQISAALDRSEESVKRLDKTRKENVRKLSALVRRHDAQPSDFDPVFAGFDEIETQGFDAALSLRFALREQLNAEQWHALFQPAVSPSTP